VLAHKVEKQKKARQFCKPHNSKPSPHEQTVSKGTSLSTPKPTMPIPFNPQKNQTSLQSLALQPSPKLLPKGIQRCLKCQGLRRLASDCTNRSIVTLAEWNAVEEENKENDGDNFEETLEEIIVEVDEGDMLTLGTSHPPRSHEHLSLFLNFSEPLLEAPNSELRAFEEVVQSKSKDSPLISIEISKGNDWKKVYKIKRDLFVWMILFQPKLSQVWKVIT